jgi:hypothetical protein
VGLSCSPGAFASPLGGLNGGESLRLDETSVFCRARVTALGSLDTKPGDAKMLATEVVPWTQLQQSDDIFAGC